MARKIKRSADAHVIMANSNRFKDSHNVQASRLGMIQVKADGKIVVTLEDNKVSSLGTLRNTYAPHTLVKGLVQIIVHNHNSTDTYEFNNSKMIWVKTTTNDGLF